MRAVFMILVLGALFVTAPVKAGQDCRAALQADSAGILTIVKGMVDYKAALDAGYAACMVQYPQQFAPLRPVNDFMQTNMQQEMTQARAVLDYAISHPDTKEVSPSCAADEKTQGALREELALMLDGQYSKAYARRHKRMADADLVSAENDSCLIVLEMVRKYEEYYGRFEKLENVLYESSKKQGKIMLGGGRDQRRTLRRYESLREQLAAQP